MNKFSKILITCLTLLAFVAGFRFVQDSGMLKPAKPDTVTVVHLKEDAPFKIRKRSEVLDHEVFRITSTRQPQEFLVLNNISPKLIEPVFGKTPNLAMVNTIANQLLANASRKEEGGNVPKVEIQEVKTLKTGTIPVGAKEVPYWEVRVKFKLSNESVPRQYDAALMRQASADGEEVLTVSFAQQNVFDHKLMADLARNMTLEEMQIQ